MLTLKRISVLFISLFLCSVCSCSPNKQVEEGLLWRISGNGLAQPSYLFGTWHGTYGILYSYLDSIPGFYQAFDSCSQYVGEVKDLEDLPSYVLKADLKLPQDTTWADLLDESDTQFLDSVLMERMKVPLSQMYVKPCFLELILDQLEEIEKLKQMGFNQSQIDSMSAQVIDICLSVKAKEKGYTVLGFETVEEQLDMLFGSDDLKRDARFLVMGLRDPYIRNLSETMTSELQAIYRSQNLNDLAQFELRMNSLWQKVPEMGEKYQESMDEMVDERNRTWVEKIPSIIKDKQTFIGVGVRHLPGEAGLIRLLQEKGYKVEAVK